MPINLLWKTEVGIGAFRMQKTDKLSVGAITLHYKVVVNVCKGPKTRDSEVGEVRSGKVARSNSRDKIRDAE